MARELVREVGDPCVAGTYARGNLKGAFETVVRDVAAAADTVDDEVVKVLQLFEFFVRNVVHVGAVGNIAEAVAQDRKLEMLASDWDNFHALNAERLLVNQMDVPFWSSWVAVLSEGI